MKKDESYLWHILDAIDDIEQFMKGIKKEAFIKNKEKQYAVIRAIEVIGEATKNLSSTLRKQHSQIPWKTIAGMRDKLIHHYFGVNINLVWEVADEKIPILKKEIKSILKEPGFTAGLFEKRKE
jgi:uncharacterized protein with HEPN domain